MNDENFSAELGTLACSQFEVALEDLVNRELGGAEAAILTEHLKSCSGCALALAEAEASARLLRSAGAAEDVGAGFARTVMARIRTEIQHREDKSIWRPFVSLAWKLSATAALASVLLITFDLRRHEMSQDQGQHELALVADKEAPELLSDEARAPSNRDEVLILMAEDGNHAKH